ncbi:hypothetical protein GCM10027037_03440 [Mucilaginibacter koreensis]
MEKQPIRTLPKEIFDTYTSLDVYKLIKSFFPKHKGAISIGHDEDKQTYMVHGLSEQEYKHVLEIFKQNPNLN